MSGRLGPAAATSGTLAGCIVAAGRQGRNTSPARRDSRADGVFEMRLSRAPRPEEVAGSRNTGVLELEFGAVSINSPHPAPHLHTSTLPHHTTPPRRTRCFLGPSASSNSPSRRPLHAPSTTPMFRYPGRGWFLSGWLAWVLTTSTCAQPTATPRLSTSREPALRHSLASLLPTCEQETHSQHSTHARAVWPSSTWERGVVWEATALHSTPSRSALDTWTQQADAVQCSAVQCSAVLA